ncbi:hypothetical protein KTS45_18835 [Halomicroarcula limicola]|uniref:Halobacterial output domain-containing protein n=1 Tax=Haloarcula limicola TaxID=1429915 RepID=A0A8J7Y8K8_9EURY|nr:hypothetical protein [Halomicroarcula limicola]
MSAQNPLRDQTTGIKLKELDDGRYAVDLERYSDQPLSTLIICSVAAAVGKDPVTLTPLRNTINPEALEAVAESATDGILSFNYSGCRVSVKCGSNIYIQPESDATTT